MAIKVAPVSADLLIKIGLGVIAFGGIAMLIYTAKSKLSNMAGVAANELNPASPNNVIYHTVNDTFGSSTGPGANADGSWSLGGWFYDVTHPGTAAAVANMTN